MITDSLSFANSEITFANNLRLNSCYRGPRSACAAKAARSAFCCWLPKPFSCSTTICAGATRSLGSRFVCFAQRTGPRYPDDVSGIAIPIPLSPNHGRHARQSPRFRHTFASDMVRAGVSLPARMQLMGHAHIHTTLVYVKVAPLEVYQQYARAMAQHIRPLPRRPIVSRSRRPPLQHPLAHLFGRAVDSLTAASLRSRAVNTAARRVPS